MTKGVRDSMTALWNVPSGGKGGGGEWTLAATQTAGVCPSDPLFIHVCEEALSLMESNANYGED
jgi:hypothetical protein